MIRCPRIHSGETKESYYDLLPPNEFGGNG